MWRKTMLYLGLGPDDEYDDYDPDPDEPPAGRAGSAASRGARPEAHSSDARSGASASGAAASPDEPSGIGEVRPIGPRSESRAEARDAKSSSGAVQTVSSSAGARPRPQAVPPMNDVPAKPLVVVPASFNEAQELADKFRGNQPIIMNLQGADRDLSRRLIDFASGLCYGLGGQMEKVANSVYLLTPSNVEVSAEERRRLQERGYDG